MPTSDAQSSRLLPQRSQIISPTHSISSSSASQSDARNPAPSLIAPPRTSLPMRPATPIPAAEQSENMVYEHAIDFAMHSWDLRTGGLKTLTAKRELPTRLDRRSLESLPDFRESPSTRSYMFAMIVLICVIFMLIGGGVILFVMLQP